MMRITFEDSPEQRYDIPENNSLIICGHQLLNRLKIKHITK